MKKLFMLPLALSVTVGFGSCDPYIVRVSNLNKIVTSDINSRLLLDNKDIMSRRISNLMRRLYKNGFTSSEINVEIEMTLFDLWNNVKRDALYKRGFLRLKPIIMQQLSEIVMDK